MKSLNEIWNISKEIYKIQQIEEEWMWTLSLLPTTKDLNILEIGSYDGGTTASLAHFADMLVSIDIHNPPRFDPYSIKTYCDKYMYIGCDSHQPGILEHIKNYKFDVLFIDGDHTYEGSKQDFEMYSPFLKDKGLIFFHDIVDSPSHRSQNCFVGKFWNEVKIGKTYKEKITADWGGIGVLIYG